MNIAVFIKSTIFHTDYGGLETFNKALCEGLTKLGHSVYVFSPKRDLTYESKEEEGVKYIFIPCSYSFSIFSSLNSNHWYVKSYIKFKEIYKDIDFKVIFSQSSAGLGILRHKEDLGLPVISVSHGTITGEIITRINSLESLKDYVKLPLDVIYFLRMYLGRQREFILKSTLVIAVSESVKKAIIAETFIPARRVVVIYNGLNPKLFRVSAKSERSFTNITYIGAINKSKGLDFIQRYINECNSPNIKFTLIGGGSKLKVLRETIKKSNVEIKGPMLHSEVIEYYNSGEADIFIFPTRRAEGFSMSLIESMFAGIPSVAADIGGNKDAIDNTKTGFLFPFKDYKAFKEKVDYLIKNPQRARLMGNEARIKALKEYTLEKMLQKYMTQIELVMNMQI